MRRRPNLSGERISEHMNLSQLKTTRNPGVYSLSFDEYAAEPGINKGLLDDFAECPLAAYETMTQGRLESITEAMVFGQLAHAKISEPERFAEMYYLRPDFYPCKPTSADPRTEKPWTRAAKWCKEWLKTHSDRAAISSRELVELEAVVAAIKAEPKAAQLFSVPGKYEQSLFGIDSETRLPMKGRPDYLPEESFLVDFKFTNDASLEAVSRSIVHMRYHVQAAIYFDLANQAGRNVNAFYFVFVQRGERPRVNVRKLSNRGIDTGRAIYQKQLCEFEDCLNSGEWPGPSGAGPDIDEVDISDFEFNRVWMTPATLQIGTEKYAA